MIFFIEDTEKYIIDAVENLSNLAINTLKDQNTVDLAKRSLRYVIDSKFSEIIWEKGKNSANNFKLKKNVIKDDFSV